MELEKKVEYLEELIAVQEDTIKKLISLLDKVNERIDIQSRKTDTLKRLLDIRALQIDNNANAISSIFKQIEQL